MPKSKSKKFRLKPINDEIENAGQISGIFLESLGLSETMVQSQIMIIQELIKNGIRCSICNPSKNDISVHLQVSANTITVEVETPVDESCSQRLQELDKFIQFIRGYQDPCEAYLILKNQSGKRSNFKDFNALALSKIVYKGKSLLDFYVSENKTLNQSAICNII